jgi:hypothetical protein
MEASHSSDRHWHWHSPSGPGGKAAVQAPVLLSSCFASIRSNHRWMNWRLAVVEWSCVGHLAPPITPPGPWARPWCCHPTFVRTYLYTGTNERTDECSFWMFCATWMLSNQHFGRRPARRLAWVLLFAFGVRRWVPYLPVAFHHYCSSSCSTHPPTYPYTKQTIVLFPDQTRPRATGRKAGDVLCSRLPVRPRPRDPVLVLFSSSCACVQGRKNSCHWQSSSTWAVVNVPAAGKKINEKTPKNRAPDACTVCYRHVTSQSGSQRELWSGTRILHTKCTTSTRNENSTRVGRFGRGIRVRAALDVGVHGGTDPTNAPSPPVCFMDKKHSPQSHAWSIFLCTVYMFSL